MSTYVLKEGAQVWQTYPGPGGRPMKQNLHGQKDPGTQILIPAQPLPVTLSTDFIEFLKTNKKLPNGRQNPLSAITPEEVRLLMRPYREWAPAPFNNQTIRSTSALNLFLFALMGRDGNPANLFLSIFQDLTFLSVDHELHFNVMRLWGGLPPISDRRWMQKDLNVVDSLAGPPVNIIKALDHLEQTQAFNYFNIPEVLDKIRTAYNRSYDHFAYFDRALNAYYAQQNPGRSANTGTRGKVADLWTEYFFSHVDFISARAHAWYNKHAAALYQNHFDAIKAVPPGTTSRSPEHEQACRKFKMIIDSRKIANVSILFPLAGFKNGLQHWKHLSSPPTVNWNRHPVDGSLPLTPNNYPLDFKQRGDIHNQRLGYLVNLEALNLVICPNPLGDTWLSDAICRHYAIGRDVLERLTLEYRGPPPELREELWITRLRYLLDNPSLSPGEPPYTKWGFIGYRLFYGHSDAEWAQFVTRFNEKAVSSWGEDVLGADEHIRCACTVTWIDGRNHGIAEGDLSAARKHYKTLCDSKSSLVSGTVVPNGGKNGAFLMADQLSIDSFLSQPNLAPKLDELVDKADIDSIIAVVQADEFDIKKAAEDEEAPGYPGAIYALASVLFDDVWPSLFSRTHHVKDFHPMAVLHPFGAYAGPLATYQRRLWERFHQRNYEKAWKMMEDAGLPVKMAPPFVAHPHLLRMAFYK